MPHRIPVLSSDGESEEQCRHRFFVEACDCDDMAAGNGGERVHDCKQGQRMWRTAVSRHPASHDTLIGVFYDMELQTSSGGNCEPFFLLSHNEKELPEDASLFYRTIWEMLLSNSAHLIASLIIIHILSPVSETTSFSPRRRIQTPNQESGSCSEPKSNKSTLCLLL